MKATELNDFLFDAGKRLEVAGTTVEEFGVTLRSMKPAGEVEQTMGERTAERLEFARDEAREQDCA